MQNYDDDDDWDDLDDYELEQCDLKENEVLSQNPELYKNVTPQPSTSKEISKRWINSHFNSFVNVTHNSKAEPNNFSKLDPISGKQSSNATSFIRPLPPKKCYKPLDIGTPSSISNEKIVDKCKDDLDFKSLQSELEQVLKEKAKVEEDNLVKQGEVFNLRCELKRKESSLEAERVDQCIALEAAEKRGKEKAHKTIAELESKVKKLEREVDRLEGDITFKNREIEELVAKCKQPNAQTFNSVQNKLKCNSSSPSPKKRKLDNYLSPNKSSFNFAERFDFGEKKKNVKNIHVQTEKEIKELKNRLRIDVTSSKGSVSGSRKAFYILSNHKGKDELLVHENNLISQNNFLSHLISSVESKETSYLNNSERLFVKHICDNLQNLMKAMHVNGAERMSRQSEKCEDSFLSSSFPLLKLLGIMKIDDKILIQNSVKIISLYIEEFLKDKTRNLIGITSSLDSLSSILKSCELTQEMCISIMDSLNKCCEVFSVDILSRMTSTLISGLAHDKFKLKICTYTTGKCLLNSFCSLVRKTSMDIEPEAVVNDMAVLVSELLNPPSVLDICRPCSCSYSLLSVFIKNLHSTVKNLSKDEEWHLVLNGLKILHTWQTKDKNLLEKASQLSTFPILLRAITRKAKLLKSKKILDNVTWELIYDVCEIDES